MRKLLHYEKIGSDPEKEWIVFLHGAGGSVSTWSPQKEFFSKHFNLLLLDLRDHGSSKNMSPSSGNYTFDLIITDIVNVLDHLSIDKAHFLTLSFGSVLIQDLVNHHPTRVQSAIMAGGVFSGSILLRLFIHSAYFLNLFLNYTSMYRLFSFLVMPRKRNQKARRLYQLSARKLNQQEYLKWLGLYSEFFKRLNQFVKQEFKIPILIVMGGDDYIFLPAAVKFAKSKPDVNMHMIKESGHICTIESPGSFNSMSLDFLNSQQR